MAAHPSRIGYLYRYAQGRHAASAQAIPDLAPDDKAAWVRGWQAADHDQREGRPPRVTPPPVVVELPPPPEASPPEPEAPPEAPAPTAAQAPQEPRIVKAKVKAADPPPGPPAVILANKAPPIEKPPPWLLLRVHREEWGFRIESEGSDATLPGNGVDALTQAIDVHVRLRLGPDESEWTR